jgi:hypothetical protein
MPLDLPPVAPDTLTREKFARLLSDTIAILPRNRSEVTAVYVPRRSGKSWLRGRIVGFLKTDHPASISVCEFAPWDLNSNTQILEEFFKTISLQVPKEEDLKGLSTLWERLGHLAIAGSLGTSAVATAWQMGGGRSTLDKASSRHGG